MCKNKLMCVWPRVQLHNKMLYNYNQLMYILPSSVFLVFGIVCVSSV
jgi:hypothetical protein